MLSDIEIIIVDDGSTDNAASSCGEFQKRDSRIKVICKEKIAVKKAKRLWGKK